MMKNTFLKYVINITLMKYKINLIAMYLLVKGLRKKCKERAEWKRSTEKAKTHRGL